MRTIFCLTIILFILSGFAKHQIQDTIPIYFEDYGIYIHHVKSLGDTILYKQSSKENFKLVIFHPLGKSYVERYLNGQLTDAGYYANSLDTLKRYVSSRRTDGTPGQIKVMPYFEPLKHGKWLTYKNGRIIKIEEFKLGVTKD